MFGIALTAVATLAVPAKRVKRVIRLADGTTVETTLRGDEHMKMYVADDGRKYRYVKADLYEEISEPMYREMCEHAKARRYSHEAHRAVRASQHSNVKARTSETGTEGKKKGLVILVNFDDVKMKSTSTKAAFEDMMNKKGYNLNGHYGSVRDYFLDQSYGKLDITFDVVGPVTVFWDMAYYGSNAQNGDDMFAGEMVAEACKLADEYVNFADYDWDGDGEVDQVYVIYAGYGESAGASENTIWPHEFTLDEAHDAGDGEGALTLDGVKVNTYACSCELEGTYGSKMTGIGTCCHEFSHCLGLPDLYDNLYETNFGMDAWSIMDYGCYNNDGAVPCAYTAYERMYAGWLNPVELENGHTVSAMKPITSDEPTGYIIYNKKYPTEYYILQNIQKEKWNKGAYGHGLLVMHVDYDEEVWAENAVNNSKFHQRCTIIPADDDANYAVSSLPGDPYPGTAKNTSLTDDSEPAADLFNRNMNGTYKMGKPITDITESNGFISFKFNGGGPEPPVVAVESIVDGASKTHGISYDVMGRVLRDMVPAHGLYFRDGAKYIVR